jgi:2-polyprenyl-3-methyl-5-hydroxy-6-metoxy-1,4-benzoquinol methylase
MQFSQQTSNHQPPHTKAQEVDARKRRGGLVGPELSVNPRINRTETASDDRFWTGTLQPHLEHGEQITEKYANTNAVLLVDQNRDYFTFDTFPTSAELIQFYNNDYPSARRDNWYNSEQQYQKSRWNSIVERIESLAGHFERPPENIRVHDSGCGFGGLVDVLRSRGFDCSGTDLCAEAIKGGRTEKKNRWIHDERTEDFLSRSPAQTIIVLSHVLEHVLDPLEYVRQLSGFLEPRGAVLVRCPNSQFYKSLKLSITSNWYGYPKHLHYFGPGSLARLLRAAGLTDVVVRCTETDMDIDDELSTLRGIAAQDGLTFTDDHVFLRYLLDREQTKELEAVGWAPGPTTDPAKR